MVKKLISEGIFKQAERHPDKPAVVGVDGNGANYADVVRIYKETRTFLSEIPVEATDRIIVLTEDAIIYSILALPVLEHAVLVPLDPELSTERFTFFFDLLNVKYILTDYKSGQVLKIAEERGLGIIVFNYVGGIGNLSCNFELLRKAVNIKRPPPVDDSVAMINTTSGTTSTPKIVPKPYETIYCTMQRNIKEFMHDEADVFVIIAKMHQTHSFNKVMLTLFTGGTSIVTNGFRHKEFIDLLNRNITTCFIASPAILNSLANYLEESQTIVCATHGAQLGGESPLWGLAVANH